MTSQHASDAEQLRDALRRALEASTFSPTSLSRAIGKSPDFIRDFLVGRKGGLAASALGKIERELGLEPGDLQTVEASPAVPKGHGASAGAGLTDPKRRPPNHRTALPAGNVPMVPADVVEQLGRSLEGNRDLPVMGIAVGGDGADFRFNGEIIDRIRRPNGIAHRKDIFAVYAENDSMYPAIRPGDPLILDPARTPSIGDDVVVELHGEDGEPGRSFVKRLVRRSASAVIVEQFNPPQEISFDTAEIRKVYRIIPLSEIIGL